MFFWCPQAFTPTRVQNNVFYITHTLWGCVTLNGKRALLTSFAGSCGGSQGERNLQLSFHTCPAMPTHKGIYATCPTRFFALKTSRRRTLCARKVQFLLLSLKDVHAEGVRCRRFTSKAGQRAAHAAASLEMWPRERRVFRSLFARSTRSAYGGCFARRRNFLYLVKSPQHSTGSFATVLRERKCCALTCTEATLTKQQGKWQAITTSCGVRTTAEHSEVLLLAGSAGLGRCANFAAPLLRHEPRSLGHCALHGGDLDLLDAPSTAVERNTRVKGQKTSAPP